MTIEEYLIDYLAPRLNVPVSGSVPHPLPDEFITVELTGERVDNLIPTAQVHVDCYSTSRAAAAALGRQMLSTLRQACTQPEISRVQLNSMYNNTDESLQKPRESGIFEIVYLF